MADKRVDIPVRVIFDDCFGKSLTRPWETVVFVFMFVNGQPELLEVDENGVRP